MYQMTRSKRMQPVQRVAQRREQDAMQKLGQAQQYLAAQKTKLAELRDYREQYTRQFETSSGAGLGATWIRDYRIFLGRLNEAIRQQELSIARSVEQLEEIRGQWMETHCHSQAIDKVVGGFVREERKQQDKQEQREQDEHARSRPRK